MSGAEIGLALSVFLACAVEAVEALTIVLAVGITRSWSSAIGGVGAAVLALAVIVAALGPAITSLPIGVLRVVVGGLLLVFGLQWLRKAILRAAGLKAKRDELRIYAEQAEAANNAGAGVGANTKVESGGDAAAEAGTGTGGGADAGVGAAGFDGYAFAVAFKGVLLEGLEVAFIVITFGANQHRVGLACAAAALAILIVIVAGVVARAPLARVPENTMKFAVGVMLSSFGMFWSAEGAGATWPGGDVALLVIVPGVLVAGVVMVKTLGHTSPPTATREPQSTPAEAADHATAGV